MLGQIRLYSIPSPHYSQTPPKLSSVLAHQPVNVLSKEYSQIEPDINDEIIIAMSSGVDSSVAAAIYASKYPNVRGVYMANWSQTAQCTENDWNDVKKVCEHLKIPCERVNFEREYWTQVFQPMILLYENGQTPNPDVGCNKHVKFGKMVEYLSRKFEDLNDRKWWLVTGHYSRVMYHTPSEEYHLLRGHSQGKDQSYYLSNISSTVLQHVLLPIGHYVKPDVRKLAIEYGLHVASKPDSQGLCFVSQDQKNFRQFLQEYITPKPGNIVTKDGKVWGQHMGLWHATIGQKSSISMPQGDPEYKGVWFVSEKRIQKNELVIVNGRDNPKLYKSKIEVKNWQWIGVQDIDNLKDLHLQYRSLQTPLRVKTITLGENGNYHIDLVNSARAMAPGQNIVLYKENQVLGSGIIERTDN